MVIVIQHLKLRERIACTCVCKEWKRIVYRVLRSHLDFRNCVIPLRAVCMLAATVRWKRISITSANATGMKRPAVYQCVVDALRAWSYRRGGSGEPSTALDIDFSGVKVTWMSKYDLEPLMGHVHSMSVCQKSLACLRWAPTVKDVTIVRAYLGAALDAMPPGATTINFYNCAKHNMPAGHLRRWLAQCKVPYHVS